MGRVAVDISGEDGDIDPNISNFIWCLPLAFAFGFIMYLVILLVKFYPSSITKIV